VVVQTKADEGRLRDERVWRINLFVGVKLSKVPNMTPVSCQILLELDIYVFSHTKKKQTQRQRPSSCTTKHDDRLSSSVECLRCRDVDPFPRFSGR